MTLIFCEIIEINCFGLSKNVKNNIIERSGSEEIYCDINKLEDVSSNNSENEMNFKDSDNSSIYE